MAIFISVWVCVACTVLSRYLANTALKYLSVEEKGSLTDALSTVRAYDAIPIAILLYVFVLYTHSSFSIPRMEVLFFGLVLVYLVILPVIIYRKIKQLGLPSTYTKQTYISYAIQYLGFIQLILVFVFVRAQ